MDHTVLPANSTPYAACFSSAFTRWRHL